MFRFLCHMFAGGFKNKHTMSTLKDLITNTEYFNDHKFVDVHYYLGKDRVRETMAFASDIGRRINTSSFEFVTPEGRHLYGLLRHPVDRNIYAFTSAQECRRVQRKWNEMALAAPQEKAAVDDSEWRAPYSARKRTPVSSPDNGKREWVVIWYSNFERNKQKH